MAYQALYRRWRPTTFDMVVGQEAAVSTLKHQVISGNIAHAYLFCGCRGTGKTTLAKIMSRAINCPNTIDGNPCSTCDICKAILSESTTDVLELDAASNNGVDNIRELLQQIRYPAQITKYRVYIIDEVHMLSTAAFNALLKTLEEPPPHVVFILATTEPQKLLATILSRVQRYDFGRIPLHLIIERLKLALSELAIPAEDEALSLIASASEGAMRDAFSILDMCISNALGKEITSEQVRTILGTSDKSFLISFLKNIANEDGYKIMYSIDQLVRDGRDPQVFLRELCQLTRNLLVMKNIPTGQPSFLEVSNDEENSLRETALLFSSTRLIRMLNILIKSEFDLRFSSTPRIGLESTVLQLLEQSKSSDNSALLERLEETENRLAKLQTDISSGTTGLTQKSPTKNIPAPVKTTSPTPPLAPTTPILTSDIEVWKQLLSILSKTELPLFSLIKPEKFLGAINDTYQLEVKKENILTFNRISNPLRKDKIIELLTQITGKKVGFEVVLEKESSDNIPVTNYNAEQSLFDTFGRENVQIVSD